MWRVCVSVGVSVVGQCWSVLVVGVGGQCWWSVLVVCVGCQCWSVLVSESMLEFFIPTFKTPPEGVIVLS